MVSWIVVGTITFSDALKERHRETLLADFGADRQESADSVEKVGISGWKKATLALASEPGHHVAWLSSSALTVAAWLIG